MEQREKGTPGPKRRKELLERKEDITADLAETLERPYDFLTPQQTAEELDTTVPNISNIIRQGWLPHATLRAGSGGMYRRVDVEFAKLHRGRRPGRQKKKA